VNYTYKKTKKTQNKTRKTNNITEKYNENCSARYRMWIWNV